MRPPVVAFLLDITFAASWRGFRNTHLAFSPVAEGHTYHRTQTGDKQLMRRVLSRWVEGCRTGEECSVRMIELLGSARVL